MLLSQACAICSIKYCTKMFKVNNERLYTENNFSGMMHDDKRCTTKIWQQFSSSWKQLVPSDPYAKHTKNSNNKNNTYKVVPSVFTLNIATSINPKKKNKK